MGKGHNIKNCQSKHRYKVATCNKRHHTLLYNENVTPPPATNPPPPVHPGRPNNPNDTVTFNNFKLSRTFLQILPVVITNNTKIVHTNAPLDAGSDATLIHEDIAHILNLHGKNKTLETGNAPLNSSSVQSKIVSFSVSSSLHLEKIAIDNAFAVPNLNVRYHKIDINKIRSNFPSFKDIKLPKLKNTDVTTLIGADFPKLHIHEDVRYISDEDPCAVKTELGWVLLGGKK